MSRKAAVGEIVTLITAVRVEQVYFQVQVESVVAAIICSVEDYYLPREVTAHKVAFVHRCDLQLIVTPGQADKLIAAGDVPGLEVHRLGLFVFGALPYGNYLKGRPTHEVGRYFPPHG